MKSKEKNPQILSSVQNALRVLQCFSTAQPQLGVSELAELLGVAKSTISRILATLAKENFVVKDKESGKYKLGISVLTLAGIVTDQLDIHNEATPVLNKLVLETNETAHLAILDGPDTIYIRKSECNHPVRILTHLGRRNPSYCTSSGKLLLAYENEEVIEKIINNGLTPYTRQSITDPAILIKELESIRKRGYAMSTEELTQGTRSVSAPIKDYTGKVVSAINIVGPIQRMKDYKIPEIVKKVVRAGEEASERMGYNTSYIPEI